MSLMNKCAKFHGDASNLASVIELSEKPRFVYSFVKIVEKQASNFGGKI